MKREPKALLPLHELGGLYSRKQDGEKRYQVMLQLFELSPDDEGLRRALLGETTRLLEAARQTGDAEGVRSLSMELQLFQQRP